MGSGSVPDTELHIQELTKVTAFMSVGRISVLMLTHYFNIAFYSNINCYLYYLTYTLLCTAPLSYGWGRLSKSR